jgi:hypothetical protein
VAEKTRILNRGDMVDFAQEEVLDIASVLKQFARALPTPLCPFEMYTRFLECGMACDEDSVCLYCIFNLLFLIYLFCFFVRFGRHLFSHFADSLPEECDKVKALKESIEALPPLHYHIVLVIVDLLHALAYKAAAQGQGTEALEGA